MCNCDANHSYCVGKQFCNMRYISQIPLFDFAILPMNRKFKARFQLADAHSSPITGMHDSYPPLASPEVLKEPNMGRGVVDALGLEPRTR